MERATCVRVFGAIDPLLWTVSLYASFWLENGEIKRALHPFVFIVNNNTLENENDHSFIALSI